MYVVSVSDFLSCLICSVLNLAKLMHHAPTSGKNRSSTYQNPNYESCYNNLGQFFDKLKKEEKKWNYAALWKKHHKRFLCRYWVTIIILKE